MANNPKVQELLDRCATARAEAWEEATPIILARHEAEMLSAFLTSHTFRVILEGRGIQAQYTATWDTLIRKIEHQVWNLDDNGEPREE